MLATLLTSLAGFTLLFLGLFTLRYAVERLRRRLPAVPSGETDGALT